MFVGSFSLEHFDEELHWFLLSCVHDCARDYTIRALTKTLSLNLSVVGIGYLYMVLEFWLGAGQHTREVTVPT